MRRLTTLEFIELAKEIHGDKYDYSKCVYKTKKEKVCIICHCVDKNGIEHGEFWQSPDSHSRGQGCPKCKFAKNSIEQALSTEEFIDRAKLVHNDYYSYNNCNYINAKTDVKITCPIHGDFEQNPYNHLAGKGCPECGKTRAISKLTLSNEDFISRVKKIHPNYDYSITNYTGMSNKIEYICPIHGKIVLNAQDHLHNRSGCPKCNKSHGEQFIENYLNDKGINFEQYHVISIDKNINSSGKAYADFYLPDYNTIIEYNGIQHYIPVEHFGGQITFNRLYARDTWIRLYCKLNKIRLIEIPWKVSFDIVQEILDYSFDNLDKPLLIPVPLDFFFELLSIYKNNK